MFPVTSSAGTTVPEQPLTDTVGGSTTTTSGPVELADLGRALAKLIGSLIGSEVATSLPHATGQEMLATSTTSRLRAARVRLSEAELERLAQADQNAYMAILAGDILDPSDLTVAAEVAGVLPFSEALVTALTRLLSHESALVREGAIYGLATHLESSSRARDALAKLTDPLVEPSTGVREAAEEALDLLAG